MTGAGGFVIFGMSDQLAVIPIGVNVGAAILPAIVGALANVLALLFKPRELARACRRKPHVPAIVLLVIGTGVGLGFAWGPLFGGRRSRRARAADAAAVAGIPRTDWAEVALEIIRKKQTGEVAFTPVAFASAEEVAGAPVERIFRTDSSRSGYDGGPVPLGLKMLWCYNEEDTMFLASPTVSRGRVYGASCYLDTPNNYGTLFCLDAATGRELWRTELLRDEEGDDRDEDLKGFFSSPAVTADGKRLVIGQGLHFDKDSHLVCVDTATGRICWTVETPLHIEGSPAVWGDLAVAGVGAIETVPGRRLISDPGFVIAVRISDGKELWRYPVADPESSPVVTDGVVYVGSGFHGNAVVALRTETDEELARERLERLVWRTPVEHPMTSAISAACLPPGGQAGDLVLAAGGNGDYVASDPESPEGIVVALGRTTGKVLWKTKAADAVLGAVAVRDGRAVCSGRAGEVMALDLKDGRILWRTRLSGRTPVLAAPAVTERHVFAVSQDGYLAVLRLGDGKLLEKHYLNQQGRPGEMGLSVSSPTIAGGRLFVGSETGGLRCFAGTRTE